MKKLTCLLKEFFDGLNKFDNFSWKKWEKNGKDEYYKVVCKIFFTLPWFYCVVNVSQFDI